MIIFHEGLPRSGKSYEFMVMRCIPALQAGRQVVAYIEGLDHEKIAGVAGISVERCRELLTQIEREQVVVETFNEQTGKLVKREPTWLQFLKGNALLAIDEAQEFFGVRARLTPAEIQAISEHGHHGVDIVLMGQDLKDVHATWRRRVEIKAVYIKLNGLGLENRYSVSTYKHLGGERFQLVGRTTSKYDPKYFGTYKSHVSSDTNTANFKDKRATVWSSPFFKFGVPVALVAGLVGTVSVYRFFHPAANAAVVQKAKVQEPVALAGPGARPASAAASGPPATVSKPTALSGTPEAYLADLSGKYRIRLAGLLTLGKRTGGVVEWVEGTAIKERLSLDQLRDLGASLVYSDGILRVAVGGWSAIATSWPMDADARASENQLRQARGPEPRQSGEYAGAGSFGPTEVHAGPATLAPVGGDIAQGGRGAALPKLPGASL